ncbi:MAG TPA: DUF2877 domain-containing protein [Chloroflexia bacterium]|jgi:hypothetical protein|nr:DUF2877 domain-containing protein [Chloroflexia bacterium]
MMHHFTAISAGPELPKLAGARGRVLAVLGKAVYMRSDEGYIAGIAGPLAEDGPFTLRVANIDLLVQLLKGREDTPFAGTSALIELEDIARLELGRARQWQPRLPATMAGVAERIKAVRVLVGLLGGSWCDIGLCGLAAHLYGAQRSLPLPTEVPLLRTTSTVSYTVSRKLTRKVTEFQAAATELEPQGAANALVGLLGLGAGLTPSGDDVVAGILASLVWQARLGAVPPQFAQQMVDAMRRAAPSRTNDISVCLLWHAGHGLLYAPAMELGEAMLRGYVVSIGSQVQRLLSIGHSSGADMAVGLLAGVVAGIEIESRSKVPSC